MWIKVKNTIINLDKVQYIDIVNSKKVNLILNQKQGSYITLHFEDKNELDATIELLDAIIRPIDLN
jgi:hypothetical protein